MPSDPRTAIIIINYNTLVLTVKAIESALLNSPTTPVHVLDNASPAGDGATLLKIHEEKGWKDLVTLYLEDQNHGFGRGNNVVFKSLSKSASPPDYVFLLNPDAQLRNNAVSVLTRFLDSNPKAAAAGAYIEKPDHVPVSAAFRFPSMISVFNSALSFGPLSKLLTRWSVPLSPNLPLSQVDWVSGAAVMMRFNTVEALDGFDPDFFLYFEEVELMRRMRSSGHSVWFVPDAQVLHEEGAATDVKSGRPERVRRPAYWYQSWYNYFEKSHGRPYAFVAGLLWILGAFLNLILAQLQNKAPDAPLYFFSDFWAVAMRPLIGLSPGRCKPSDLTTSSRPS